MVLIGSLGQEISIFSPVIWLKLLTFRVIADASQSDVKIGQTNEIGRYIQT